MTTKQGNRRRKETEWFCLPELKRLKPEKSYRAENWEAIWVSAKQIFALYCPELSMP
ncbi:MAG: hypothetical protein ACLSGG_00210 [[Clostridium] leptum]